MCDSLANQVAYKLSDLEFGIICTIHQEPNYRFIAEERKAACKLVDKGLLMPVIDNKSKFIVTESGEALYRFFNLKVKKSAYRLPKTL